MKWLVVAVLLQHLFMSVAYVHLHAQGQSTAAFWPSSLSELWTDRVFVTACYTVQAFCPDERSLCCCAWLYACTSNMAVPTAFSYNCTSYNACLGNMENLLLQAHLWCFWRISGMSSMRLTPYSSWCCCSRIPALLPLTCSSLSTTLPCLSCIPCTLQQVVCAVSTGLLSQNLTSCQSCLCL